MTLILVYATREKVILAADSARWDIVLNKNIGPVKKIHSIGNKSALAIGGKLIDRTEFAKQIISLRQGGTEFPDAAKMIAPALFAARQVDMQRNNIQECQLLSCWYAECKSTGCTAESHSLPSDVLKNVSGLCFMGPETEKVREFLNCAEKKFINQNGEVQFDAVFCEVIKHASREWAGRVAFPASILMMDRNGIQIERHDLDEQTIKSADTHFLVSLSPSPAPPSA